jgi:hypothetical protein
MIAANEQKFFGSFFQKRTAFLWFLFWFRTELQVVTWSGIRTTFVFHCKCGKGCTRTTLFGVVQIIGDFDGAAGVVARLFGRIAAGGIWTARTM